MQKISYKKMHLEMLSAKCQPFCWALNVLIMNYRQVCDIRRTLVGNWIVDNSNVVGASPVGAAPTTSSFST